MANENNSQSSGTSNIKVTLITVVVPAITSVIIALITAKQQTASLQQASLGNLSGGQKLCSIFVPNLWRDNLIVPQQWNTENCEDLERKMGATQFQLGCVYSNFISLGDPFDNTVSHDSPKRKPPRDCGWF
jgi:hypothetical protein